MGSAPAFLCPRCGKKYTGHPALSRVDNRTSICPDCGIREALEPMGLPAAEVEKVIAIVRAHTDPGAISEK